jgi:hypothetical protein
MRLNGWQRIGIVASVIWALVGAYLGLKSLFDTIYEAFHTCSAQAPTASTLVFCSDQFERQL